MKTILHVFPGSYGPDFLYRITFPSKYLTTKYKDLSIAQIPENHQDTFELSEQVGLLVLHLPRKLEFLSIINRRKKLGLKTIIEFSDNFFSLPKWNPAYKEASRYQLNFKKLVAAADLITVTSKGLKDIIEHDKIEIIPNYLLNTPALENKNRKGIVWAGSYGHIADLIYFRETLLKINEIEPVTIAGEAEFRKIIDLNFVGYLPYEEYLANFQRFKLGLVIGRDDEYSRCRSDIKPIEMISQGLLPILPSVPQYKDLINTLGLPSYKTKEDLLNLIKLLLSKPTNLEAQRLWVNKNRLDFSLFEEIYFDNLSLNGSLPFETGFHEVSSQFSIDPLTNILKGNYSQEETLLLLEKYLVQYPESIDAAVAICSLDPTRIHSFDISTDPRFLILSAKNGDLESAKKLLNYPIDVALQGLVHIKDMDLLLLAYEELNEPQVLLFRLAERYKELGDFENAKDCYSKFIQRQEWLLGNSNTHPYALDFANAFLDACKS